MPTCSIHGCEAKASFVIWKHRADVPSPSLGDLHADYRCSEHTSKVERRHARSM